MVKQAAENTPTPTHKSSDVEVSHNASTKRLRFLDREGRGFFSYKDSLGLLCVGTLGLHLIILVVSFLQYGALSRLANQPPPTLVQTESGQAFPVAVMANDERTPEVIQAFVLDTLTLLFSWSGNPGTEENEPDRGVVVSGSRRVTSTAAIASYAMSSDFRAEMLNQLAEMTPAGVFSGRTQVFFEPLNIEEPIAIAQGQWKVTVIGNLIVTQDRRKLEDRIPFNKEIFLQAVTPPRVWESSSLLEQEVASVRAAGLEITEIRDIEP
ncbi:MAG: hypothetical protein ACLFV6_11275 [Spirulinaceae cyanobacterium]